MSVFTYYHEGNASGDIYIRSIAHHYLTKNNWKSTQQLIEQKSTRLHWQKRMLGDFFRAIPPGKHTLVVYDALELAGCTSQILDLLNLLLSKQTSVTFIKYKITFYAKPKNELHNLIQLVRYIDQDFMTDTQPKDRRALGVPLGRPKGSHNKSLKLDRHKHEIMNYIELGVSKSAIAKLVGCHPQTLYDWLARHKLPDKTV